jgi:CCR4-NOT complex subunit CAF16
MALDSTHDTAANVTVSAGTTADAVYVRNLTFGYGGANILENLALSLPHGARCLLVGLNGAGSTFLIVSLTRDLETTLLRILAGKRLTKGDVYVLGRQAYHDTPQVRH